MRILKEFFSLLTVLFVTEPAYAQSVLGKSPRVFGQRQRLSLQELLTFKLPSRLENLPPPTISLNTSGFKVKNRHHVYLSWTGSNNVDIYLNDSLVTTVNGNHYEDNIGSKGSATYTHKVCDTVTGACSNVTMTAL